MADCLDHITSTSLTLGANEGGTLGDAAQRLSKVTSTANEWNFEAMFVDMVLIVCRSQDLRFVNIIDTDGLEDL